MAKSNEYPVWVKRTFGEIPIGSFFFENSKLCQKIDDDSYIVTDTLKEEVNFIECLPSKEFQMVNISYSFIREDGQNAKVQQEITTDP